MARIEVIGEWFFPQAVKIDGLMVPAQKVVVDKYQELKDGWLKNHPELLKEEPMVSLAPGEKDNQPGYFVTTEIMYIKDRNFTVSHLEEI